MKFIIFLFLLMFTKNSLADDISDFQINGISIGDSLLNYMSKSEIQIELKRTREIYSFLNNDFGEVYLFDNFDFGSYDALSFMVSQKDKNYLIYEVRGMLYFIEEPNRCIEKRNQIDKELSQIFSNLEKKEIFFKSRHDPSGKSTKDKILYKFNNGDEIQLSCSNWEENLRKKNNWTEGLSVIVTSKEINDWMTGN